MVELIRRPAFNTWFDGLTDERGKGAVTARLQRLQLGNAGDSAPVGEGVSELRIHVGPGYRVYFIRRGKTVIVVLGGGDKDDQKRDIVAAKAEASALE